MTEIRVMASVDPLDVLADISDELLIAEYEDRELGGNANGSGTLESIFEEFQRRGDAPQILRDFLYERLGRIL